MTFRNLTPHRIVIRPDKGDEIIVEPSGQLARVTGESVEYCADPIEGIAVSYCGGGRAEIPPAEAGVVDLVSRLVLERLTAQQLAGRLVVAPDTGPKSVIRDAAGQIEAVRRLLATRAHDQAHAIWRRVEGSEFWTWACVGVFPTYGHAALARNAARNGSTARGPYIYGDGYWSQECLILPLGVTPDAEAKGEL